MQKNTEARIIPGPIKGQTLEILDEKVIIEGSVAACDITVNSDLEILGHVSDCIIRSNGGDIRILGGVKNSNLEIFSDISAQFCENSQLSSSHGACYIRRHVYHSSITAMSLIQTGQEAGEVLASNLSCSIEILSKQVGRPDSRKNTILELRPRKKQDMFELFFVYKQKLAEKEKKLAKLERAIKVFQLIKDKIHALPEKQKKDLVVKINEYRSLKHRVDQIKTERARMFLKNPEEDKYNRAIVIPQSIYPPAKVIIDKREMDLTNPEEETAFYKSGIIIQGSVDKIANKRKTVAVR